MGLDICSGMRKVLNDSVSSKMSTRLRSPLRAAGRRARRDSAVIRVGCSPSRPECGGGGGAGFLIRAVIGPGSRRPLCQRCGRGGVPHRDCRIFGIANSPGTLDEATWYPTPGHGLPGSRGRRGRGRGEGRDGGRDGAEPCEGAMGRLGEGREAARPREWSLARARGDDGRGGACALARGSKGAGARWGEEPRHGGRSPAPLPRPPGRASARPGGCQPATQQAAGPQDLYRGRQPPQSPCAAAAARPGLCACHTGEVR